MLKKIRVLFILYLLFTLLAAAWKGSRLWGVSSWLSFSFTGGVILALLALIFLHPRAADKIRSLIPPRAGFRKWLSRGIIALSVTAMWMLRAQHDFWGERRLIAAAVERGVFFRPGAPLSTLLHGFLFKLLNTAFLWNAEAVSSLLSVISGLGFILAAATLPAFIPEESEDRGLFLLSSLYLAVNGYLVIFFGAGGNAPVAASLSALFILSALAYLAGQVSLLPPTLLFFLSLFSHLSALYLLPGYLYLLISSILRAPKKYAPRLSLLMLVILSLALERVVAGFCGGLGTASYLWYALTAAADSWLKGGAGDNILWALNELLIIGPVSLAALFFLFSRRESSVREETFLRLLAASGIILILLGAKRVEGGLRWDIFAAAGPALSVFSLWMIRRRIPVPAQARYVLTLLTVLGFFHFLPLLSTGYSVTAGEERLLVLPLESGRNEKILALEATALENPDRAYTWLEKGLEKNPEDHQAWYLIGLIDMQRDEFLDAITHFGRALKRNPENVNYRMNLVEAFIANRWYEEAAHQLEILIQSYPDQAEYWTRLGYARNHGRMFLPAIAAYEKALSLDPRNKQYVLNLTSAILNRGSELQGEGKIEEAKEYYHRSFALTPDNFTGLNNLATIEMEAENWSAADSILERAKRFFPLEPKVYFNLGLVKEKLGLNREAYQLLKKSAELNPLVPSPSDHLERIQKKLEEEKER
ncbi:MAG: tetratricopeptide repeat protein [Candidatus Krumholzibacteriota bacterium]|nr:tetratricopeptide repeat protein [Candidatus Krumholzibacteriota bacterium]